MRLKERSDQLDCLRFEHEVTVREMDLVKEQKASMEQELALFKTNMEVSWHGVNVCIL